MRTPNTVCVVCNKELYRRPKELLKYPVSCCLGCRSAYYKQKPTSPNLSLGRKKGTNNLLGIPKSEKSKLKRSLTMSKWCNDNPDRVKQRGIKTRGENHYKWSGGLTILNQSIRRLTENRKWADSVKDRDKKCVVCGSIKELESDHIIPLSVLINLHNIKNLQDARDCKYLWNVNNGITLCKKCHCEKHNRKYSSTGNGRRKVNNDYSKRNNL